MSDNDIRATITLVRIASDEEARRLRFLGSPTVRVNGDDVEPGSSQRHDYALQCRVYQTSAGLSGLPPDQWILGALSVVRAAEQAADAVRDGDIGTLQRLLDEYPALLAARLPRHGGRSLLHVATDWPGHIPNAAEIIRTLVNAGADPNSAGPGPHPETPLHWAASSNDIAALDALLDAGADVNAPGGVIGGGSPLADATAFGQWAAAYRLVERGAAVDLWAAATLGLVPQLREHLDGTYVTNDQITSSFWGACHGGHVDTATILLARGADINWIGYDSLTPLDAARRSSADHVVAWLLDNGAVSATELE